MQRLEVGPRIGRQGIRGPLRGEGGVPVEIVAWDRPDRGEVVIAGDRVDAALTQQVDAFVRPGAVADKVAEAPQPIDRPHVIEDGEEGSEVAVDVADDADAHLRGAVHEARLSIDIRPHL